jgi:hypothetical protein
VSYVNNAVERAQEDQVNSPSHYNAGGIECIDAIEASLGPKEFRAYCKGNAMKYLWRYTYKGKPREDLQKAIWYISRMVETLQDP